MANPQSLEEKIELLEVQLQSARRKNQEIHSQQNPKFLRATPAPAENEPPQKPRPSARYDRDVSDLAMSRDSPKFCSSVEYSEPLPPELSRVPYTAFPTYPYAPPQMYPPQMMLPNMYPMPMMVPQSFQRENWVPEEPDAHKERELAQAKKDLESYKEQVLQLKEQVFQLKEQSKDVVGGTGGDLEELDHAREALSTASIELQYQREMNTHLENKFSAARTQLRAVERELEKAHEQNNALSADLEDFREKHSALQKTLSHERTAHKNELAFLEVRSNEAPVRRQQAPIAVRELHEKTSEDRAPPGPAANLQHYLTTLQLEKTRLENEFHRLPGQPRNMADKKRKQDLQLELEIVQTNVNNLKAKLKNAPYR